MQNIELGMRWDPTPLGARVALAMSKVFAALDPERGEQLRDHAHDLAMEVGLRADDGACIPAFLSGEEVLVQGFHYGRQQAADHAEDMALHPPPCGSERGMLVSMVSMKHAQSWPSRPMASCPAWRFPDLAVIASRVTATLFRPLNKPFQSLRRGNIIGIEPMLPSGGSSANNEMQRYSMNEMSFGESR